MLAFIRKYYLTITFTLLALLNLLSFWGTLGYRCFLVVLNIVACFSAEAAINNRVSPANTPLAKGMFALAILFLNCILILITFI